MGHVDFIDGLCRLQFDEYLCVHQQVSEVIPDLQIIIPHFDRSLLHDGMSLSAQFVSQRVLVYLFKKPRAEHFADTEGTTNDALGDVIQSSSAFIGGSILFSVSLSSKN